MRQLIAIILLLATSLSATAQEVPKLTSFRMASGQKHTGEVIHRADPNRTRDQQRRAFAIVYHAESAKRDEVAFQKYQQRLASQHQQMGLREVDV